MSTHQSLPIRVVHLVRTLDVGGLEMVVFDLIRCCDRNIVEPVVVCLGAPGEMGPMFEAEGIRIIPLHIHGGWMPRRIAVLSRKLRELKPDVLHTHNTSPHINGALAKWFAQVPTLIHTKHGRNTHDKTNSSLIKRLTARASDRIVAVSLDAEDLVVNSDGVPSQRVQVIWNGVDTSKYQPKPDDGQPFAPNAIHVARLNPIKDQSMLLHAVRKVVDVLPEFKLDIVGDGPIQNELENICKELKLQSSVQFLGMRTDVNSCLSQSEIFLLSSKSEGICVALLEAMSSGLSVVATDVGGNREVVQDGTTGLLVPSGDAAAFANAILRLCANPKLSRDMGKAGRKRVEDHFSLKAMVDSYARLYFDVLEAKAGSRHRERLGTLISRETKDNGLGTASNETSDSLKIPQSQLLIAAFESGWKRRNTFHYWRQLEQTQWDSRESLRKRQLTALRRLLDHASIHCPYYTKEWIERGLAPSSVRTLDDFTQWPLIDRDTIRARRADMRANVTGMKLISKTTGGSSGVPLAFDLNLDSDDRRMAAWHRGYSWAGAGPGTRQVYLWGMPIGVRSWSKLLSEAFYQRWLYRRKVLNTFDLSEETMPEYLRSFNRFKPDVLVAYTNPLDSFARWLEVKRLTPYTPKSIVVGAEKLHDFQRQRIERVFGAPVFETYGSREFMLIGAECNQHAGLHLTAEHLLVEVVDDDGQPVPDGEEGQVVITDLFNYGMPFIRYLTGDRAIAGFTNCPCGRGLPLLRHVIGRQLDILTTPNGRHIPGEFFPHLIKDFSSVRRFQVVQTDPDRIVLKLVVDDQWSAATRDRLARQVEDQIGESLRLRIEEVDDIPLTSAGKLQVVVNQCAGRDLSTSAVDH